MTLTIFQYDFMLRAFAVGIMTAVIAPTVGVFIVARRFSFLADTLAHVSLVGVVVGYMTGISPVLSALLVSSSTAVCIEGMRQKKRVLNDTTLSVFLSGGLALVAVLLSAARGMNIQLHSALFGSITAVTSHDVWTVMLTGILLFVAIASVWKELQCLACDEELAIAGGIPAAWINGIFIVIVAMTVALSMRIVGALLIGALMVIPAGTATQVCDSFRSAHIVAVVTALASVVAGLFASYYLGFSSGGTIVIVNIAFFFLAGIWRKLCERA